MHVAEEAAAARCYLSPSKVAAVSVAAVISYQFITEEFFL